MTTRKIVLLAVFFALLAVCIVQGVLGSINPVKIIKTDATPDTITIKNSKNEIYYIPRNTFNEIFGKEK